MKIKLLIENRAVISEEEQAKDKRTTKGILAKKRVDGKKYYQENKEKEKVRHQENKEKMEEYKKKWIEPRIS